MKRFYALGCSFTNYAWPTWADILGCDFDTYENWAYPGLGNRAIAERVANLHALETLTPEDTVIIQWTSHLRHDWHTLDQRHDTQPGVGWKTSGSIFNFINANLYDEKWIKTFFDEHSYMMHTLNAILLTQKFLEGIGVNYYMTSMGYINKMNSDYPQEEADSWHGESSEEIDIWKDIPKLTIYKDKIFNDRWLKPIGIYAWTHQEKPYKFLSKNGAWTVDRHPTVNQHNDYVNNIVKPKLKLSQNSSNNAEKWIDIVNNCYTSTHGNFDYFVDSIGKQLDGWGNYYRGF